MHTCQLFIMSLTLQHLSVCNSGAQVIRLAGCSRQAVERIKEAEETKEKTYRAFCWADRCGKCIHTCVATVYVCYVHGVVCNLLKVPQRAFSVDHPACMLHCYRLLCFNLQDRPELTYVRTSFLFRGVACMHAPRSVFHSSSYITHSAPCSCCDLLPGR
jgi:hypothetical protein